MSQTSTEKTREDGALWLWFIRGTMLIVWPIMVWALNTLISVDKNQGLVVQQLTTNTKRIEKLENRFEADDKERLAWLRERSRRRDVTE